MAKKSKTSKLERQFLADLKRIEIDEANQTRKSNQKRGHKKANNRSSKKNDLFDKSGRTGIRAKSKPVRKVAQLDVRKHVSKSKGKSGKRIAGSVEITRTKRTDQKIHLFFKNVRSVDNKVKLLNSDSVDKELTKQFKRKKGEPPLGMVVTVTDKNGVSASDLAPDTMVINKANAKEFAERFLKSLGTQYKRTRNYKRGKRKGEVEDDGDTGYDDYNPENVQTITIKFIYAKN
jgi:hypothetical protein